MFDAETIKRFERFTRAFRKRRPNSPIVKGVKDGDGNPLHLTIDELEALVKLARNQLPLREAMKLHETKLWAYDPARGAVVAVRTRTESRIEAGL